MVEFSSPCSETAELMILGAVVVDRTISFTKLLAHQPLFRSRFRATVILPANSLVC